MGTTPQWLEKYNRKFEIEKRRRDRVQSLSLSIVQFLHARMAELAMVVESVHALNVGISEPRQSEYDQHSGTSFEIYRERRSVRLFLASELGQLFVLRNNALWSDRPPSEWLDINISGDSNDVQGLHFEDASFRLVTLEELLEMIFVPVAFPQSLWKEVYSSGDQHTLAQAVAC